MSRITLRSLVALVALLLIAALPAAAQAKRHGTHGAKKTKKARKADRNRDGLPDRWERANGLSLRVNQAHRDQDSDGLDNTEEFKAGTKPCDRDSDDDGVKDDQEHAGKITSFADGVLTIELFAGGTVSGKVDASTEIRCGEGDHHGSEGAHSSSRGEDEGPSDDGPNHDAGDDKGGTSGSGDGPGHHEDDDTPTPVRPPAPVGTTQDATPPPSCTVADLTPGAIVHEAEVKVTDAGSVFHEIKLAPAPVPTPTAT